MRRRDFISLLGGATATVWPLAARAQQPAMRVIGFLHFGSPDLVTFQATTFGQGLKETGYVEGQNVRIEYRRAEGRYDRLPSLAADLVSRKVDLIAAFGPPSATAAKNATSTIPIVFTVGSDPVQDGLVTSLASAERQPHRHQYACRSAGPQAAGIAFRADSSGSNVCPARKPEQWLFRTHDPGRRDTARAKGMPLSILKASTESEIDAAFATLGNLRIDALVIGDDPFFTAQRGQLVALASRYAVPTTYQFREFAVVGGLASYGPGLKTASRDAGIYAGKILKGAKPSDLPVAQPTRFELVINLKTAKALGLDVPPTLLARADEVIE